MKVDTNGCVCASKRLFVGGFFVVGLWLYGGGVGGGGGGGVTCDLT